MRRLALAATFVLTLLPGLGSARPVHAAKVKLGVDVLIDSYGHLLAGKRVGLITNASAVDGNLVPTVERLLADKRFTITQLYAPEHGLAAATANGTSNKTGTDPITGIPVEGLFGKRHSPSPDTLARIDVLVFDIQDIGSRTYTYVSTMGKSMIAAKKTGKPFIVLDRPNPNGGLLFEGATRAPKYKSLIGWGPTPVTHGMTVGELARFFNATMGIGCALQIVPMEGWRREMIWEDTGLQWVPTSPGIPHPLNAHFYVATGMVGGSGTNLNEGGGNSMPFELVGAPWIDGKVLAAELARHALPGVTFRPLVYKPRRGQYAKKIVGGVHLVLTDPKAFRPLRTALTILVAVRKGFPEQFHVKKVRSFGRVWGNDEILPMIMAGKSALEIEATWARDLEVFAAERAKHLLYN